MDGTSPLKEPEALSIYEGSIDDLMLHPDMLKEHWEELGMGFPLNPDFYLYNQLYHSGGVIVLIAKLGDEVVGYSLNIIQQHLHYKGVICCHNDTFFIRKAYRHLGIGSLLIKETEETAGIFGCKRIFWSCAENTNFHRYLTKNYKVQEVVFVKDL